MELLETDFSGGLVGAFSLVEAEGLRQRAARERVLALAEDPRCSDSEYQAAREEAGAMPPLWQRVCRFRMSDVGLLPPASLRAGIRRLLRVVEQLFRDELATGDLDEDGGPSKLASGEVSYAGRSDFWDPLDEICSTLGIAPRCLSSLCKMRTGLRSRELCDAIRAEKLRSDLKGRFEGLMLAWHEGMSVEEKGALAKDWEGAAHRFLKWMRGGARGANRKRLAFEYGMTSSERLERAAFVVCGETLEELEIAVAMEVIRSVFGGGSGSGVGLVEGQAGSTSGSQGACFRGVDPGNPWATGRFVAPPMPGGNG